MHTYTVRQLLELLGKPIQRNALLYAEESRAIPEAHRRKRGTLQERYWLASDLPAIGRKYGLVKPLATPRCVAVYSSKGGVLKTTLAFNLARLAAISDIQTCVIGLDYQCDITSLLGDGEGETIDDALHRARMSQGLYGIFRGDTTIKDAIRQSDLPTLHYIPENGNLLVLERTLYGQVARERVLQSMIEHLKKRFSLIILDCNPSWTVLTDNALVACDTLISPVECKIGQFRNLEAFRLALNDFSEKVDCSWTQIYVPTRFFPTKRISCDIYAWYRTNLPGTTAIAIKESTVGEEACGENLSIPEYKPSCQHADDMRELTTELWQTVATPVRARAA